MRKLGAEHRRQRCSICCLSLLIIALALAISIENLTLFEIQFNGKGISATTKQTRVQLSIDNETMIEAGAKSFNEDWDKLNQMQLAGNEVTAATHQAKAQSSTDNETEIEAGAKSFMEGWDKLKQLMCPHMTPNPNVWPALFEFSRKELGIESNTKPIRGNKAGYRDFFMFSSYVTGYMSPNEHDRLAYLSIWKGANNQIKFNMQKEIKRKDGKFFKFSHVRELVTTIPKEQLKQMCIVTAVRDPVSHFLSGYNEMEYRSSPEDKKHGFTWPMENPPPFTRYGNGTIDRFEQFVAGFIAKPRGVLAPDLPHVYSMTGILWALGNTGCAANTTLRLTSYLPSISEVDTEFPKFLSKTCPLWNSTEPFNKKTIHESQFDEHNFYAAAKRVWAEQGKTARALCGIHALDYACFDKLPVPDLCQSVFAGSVFFDLVSHAAKTGNLPSTSCSDKQ